jgi:hypothetical protein
MAIRYILFFLVLFCSFPLFHTFCGFLLHFTKFGIKKNLANLAKTAAARIHSTITAFTTTTNLGA